MTKKQWLEKARASLEDIEKSYPCTKIDSPPMVFLGVHKMLYGLSPASVTGDELQALFHPFFERAQAAKCTEENPCSECQARTKRFALLMAKAVPDRRPAPAEDDLMAFYQGATF